MGRRGAVEPRGDTIILILVLFSHSSFYSFGSVTYSFFFLIMDERPDRNVGLLVMLSCVLD